MKRALLVSPHFAPSNLAGAQRTRLIASHLAEFGWEPVVVTVDPAYYEEENDPALLQLFPERLRIERVRALPSQICRPLGFGDISLRAQLQLRQRVAQLHDKADLIFATVLPGYASLVGAWAKRKFKLPYVLDYQDPWVSDWGAKQPRFSKAGIAHWLATKLEPKILPLADALTAVSDETLEGLRTRNLIRSGTPVEIFPIGAEPEDHSTAARAGKSFIEKEPGIFNLAYIGTLTELMLPVLKALLRAIADAGKSKENLSLRLHLIGTSAQADGEDTLGIWKVATKMNVGDKIQLRPRRIPYLDALRSMQDADALLLIGSTDSHYTASKIFPCWLAGRPILALFHERSTVSEIARELGGVRVITYDDSNGPETRTNELASALREISERKSGAVPPRREMAFAPYSAKAIARRYAALFDRVLAMKN